MLYITIINTIRSTSSRIHRAHNFRILFCKYTCLLTETKILVTNKVLLQQDFCRHSDSFVRILFSKYTYVCTEIDILSRILFLQQYFVRILILLRDFCSIHIFIHSFTEIKIRLRILFLQQKTSFLQQDFCRHSDSFVRILFSKYTYVCTEIDILSRILFLQQYFVRILILLRDFCSIHIFIHSFTEIKIRLRILFLQQKTKLLLDL